MKSWPQEKKYILGLSPENQRHLVPILCAISETLLWAYMWCMVDLLLFNNVLLSTQWRWDVFRGVKEYSKVWNCWSHSRDGLRRPTRSQTCSWEIYSAQPGCNVPKQSGCSGKTQDRLKMYSSVLSHVLFIQISALISHCFLRLELLCFTFYIAEKHIILCG